MSDFKSIPGGICAPKGFSAAGVHCGIRHNHSKLDLALIKADVRCAGAGCYTTNKVYGAPITVDREHLKDGYAQAIVVNSGNANTCAPNGVQLAKDTCDIVAKELGIRADDVLPSSTGVIGQAMSIEPFAKGIPEAAAKLAASGAGSHDAATAIMTTDTHPKEIALEFAVGGKAVRIGAIAKGSGMIHPNMATMLLFMTTDAKVAPAALQKALSTVVPATFNQISVDGDTSTNDTVLLLASGLSGAEIAEGTPDYDTFVAALTEVAEHLSRELAGDGEGATKLLECTVTGAPDLATARAVSKSVIHSTCSRPPCSARTPTGAACSAPSATRRAISTSARRRCASRARPVRSLSARTPPTTPTARTRPRGAQGGRDRHPRGPWQRRCHRQGLGLRSDV